MLAARCLRALLRGAEEDDIEGAEIVGALLLADALEYIRRISGWF